jgi:hypothetical protein
MAGVHSEDQQSSVMIAKLLRLSNDASFCTADLSHDMGDPDLEKRRVDR